MKPTSIAARIIKIPVDYQVKTLARGDAGWLHERGLPAPGPIWVRAPGGYAHVDVGVGKFDLGDKQPRGRLRPGLSVTNHAGKRVIGGAFGAGGVLKYRAASKGEEKQRLGAEAPWTEAVIF
jgi:hypothetical protein